MAALAERLVSELEANGYRGRIIPVTRVQELKLEIERQHKEDLFDSEFHKVWLEKFAFEPPRMLADARSVIITAVPHPKVRVTFRMHGEASSFVIPPTYLHYTDKLAEEVLRGVLNKAGHRLARAILPAKLLAVRSGLARYGRNNISYIAGLGSYYRLRVFYTDLPPVGDPWQEVELLEECEKCTACVKACPTGAIASDRFLLHAEKCIPFFNERHVDFPGWMDASWHNSLIGCMICQNVCPVDKPFRDWVEDRAQFSEEETDLILDGVPFGSHALETQRKLRDIEWTEELDILGRNLRTLVAQSIE